MSREVIWHKVLVERFVEIGCLSQDEEEVDPSSVSTPTISRSVLRVEKYR